MKQLVLVLMVLAAKVAVAQSGQLPTNIKSAFEGVWQYKDKFQTNTVKIQFETGRDYALFTDIGTGVAPSKTFKVQLKDNLLVLPAIRNQNDYLEMEIVEGKLYLCTIPAQWDSNGKLIGADIALQERRIFRHVKK